MFEKILFPTDFSTHAQAELACLSSFPFIREIVLLHIVKKLPIPMGKAMIEAMVTKTMQGYLDEARRYLGTLQPGITVTLEMTTSADIAGGILDVAVKREVDLIVISGYVRSFKAGILLGRVPATVLCRISRTNVLVMPNRLIDTLDGAAYDKFCRSIFSRILCPTGFSDFSKKAITRAGETRGVREIIILHVIPMDADEHSRADAEKRLAEIPNSLAVPAGNVRTLVTSGERAREIARVADAEDVSVIWMSSSSKGCLVEFLSGSLVHDVVMNGTWPTLIVRSAE
jgi:nucleotide-binding universal stress UspA family protein